MKTKFTKEDIGRTFYAEPTGNNIDRSKNADNSARPIVLKDMRRTKGEFYFSDSKYSIECEFRSGDSDCGFGRFYIDTGFYSGYFVYESLEAYTDYVEAEKAARYIKNKLTYRNCPDSKPKNIIEAAKILGWKDEQ